jgi:tetratricopeptide (TPR) repeat protein
MKLSILLLVVCIAIGCNNAAQPVVQEKGPVASEEKPQTAIAHSLENQTPKNDQSSGGKSKWTQSGDPISTEEFDEDIANLEIALKKNQSDNDVKRKLAEIYFRRASALTEARQYASALGDYRRALKLDPANTEAKDWIEKIIGIYGSINREYPKEGEEPPPLPFKSEKAEK